MAVCLLAMSTMINVQAKTEEEEIADNWGYYSSEVDWSSGDLEVTGYFYNENKNYDIINIEDFEFQIINMEGMILAEAAFDDQLEKIVIPSDGKLEWTLILTDVTLDINDLEEGYECDIAAKFSAIECDGEFSCDTCSGWRKEEEESGQVQLDDGYKICGWCSGEKLITCGYCSGKGIDLWGNSCSRCGGDGKIDCICCKGTGILKDGEPVQDTQKPGKQNGMEYCSLCGGSGRMGYCTNCSGTGTVTKIEFKPYYGGEGGGGTYEVQEPCPLCIGGEKKCYACNGTGF